MSNIAIVNEPVLRSIPIRKDFKSYFIGKYRHLVKHNGLQFACDTFGNIRTTILSYLSDPQRHANYQKYRDMLTIRKNGWTQLLFQYADCQPNDVLNFFKLYIGMNEPIVNVSTSAERQHAYLKEVEMRVNDSIPDFLVNWVQRLKKFLTYDKHFHASRRIRISSFYERERTTSMLFPELVQPFDSYYMRHHSNEEFTSYWSRWSAWARSPRLELTDEEISNSIIRREPIPEMYVDVSDDSVPSSTSLDLDLFDLLSMQGVAEGFYGEKGVISIPSIQYVLSKLTPLQLSLWDSISQGEISPPKGLSFLSGHYVGFIHHIPKKGTVKRRAIAVPNRFLQMGMAPIHLFLERVVSGLPQDCTFNQARFDMKIQNRINNHHNLYTGSVDLSQATDNFPLSWGKYIVDELFGDRYLSKSSDLSESWDLFQDISRCHFNNDGIMTRWTKGQPLGTLPSFMLLALSHNIYLEALSYSKGYGHSPYSVLGDDVLVFNKKLRKAYIHDLRHRGIPLSLHKSYQSRLVEFAGKTFVPNHLPFYTSDQAPVEYRNLFDYQRSTGITIPWNRVPKRIKSRIARVIGDETKHREIARDVYELAQKCEVYRKQDPTISSDPRVPVYFEYLLPDDRLEPEPISSTGIVSVGGHPITYLDYGYAEKHGHKMRYRRITLPQWKREKFSPNSTDNIIRASQRACSNS